VGWVSKSDGLLVRDINGDGVINNGAELFGSATQLADGHRAGNGYNALAELDLNHDGKIDAHDAVFGELKVWVDGNSNGLTDAGELHGLAELGVASLDLHAQAGSATDNGNLLALVSSYTTTDGATHDMADVWFARDNGTAAAKAAAEVTVADLLVDPGQAVLGGESSSTTTAAADGKTTTTAGTADPSTAATTTASADSGSDSHAAATSATTTTAHDTSVAVIDVSHLIDDKQNNILI
jgi:hypothetical protein